MRWLKTWTDYRDPESLVNRLRRRRFAFFLSLLESLPRPLALLDVGGTELFWRSMGAKPPEGMRVTLLNIGAEQTSLPGFESVAGDARDMRRFNSGQFDVVFSNSVIEHLHGIEGARAMAAEVRRVGKRYFVQTPNRHFPMEPHVLIPFYQYLPRGARVALLMHFQLGHLGRIADRERAREVVNEIRLLSAREIRELFPGARLYRETIFGLTKSLAACGGWPEGEGKPV